MLTGPGPCTDRRRQPRLGEPVRRPEMDLLPGRGVDRASAVLRRTRRRCAATLRRRAELSRCARRLGHDARLSGLRRRRRTADAVPHLAQHQHRRRRGAIERRSSGTTFPIGGASRISTRPSLNGEDHVDRIGHLTTLAGYVHWQLTGEKVLGVGDASGMFPIDIATGGYDAAMLAQFDHLAAEAGVVRPAGRPAADDHARRGAGRRAHRNRARSCSTRPGGCVPAS